MLILSFSSLYTSPRQTAQKNYLAVTPLVNYFCGCSLNRLSLGLQASAAGQRRMLEAPGCGSVWVMCFSHSRVVQRLVSDQCHRLNLPTSLSEEALENNFKILFLYAFLKIVSLDFKVLEFLDSCDRAHSTVIRSAFHGSARLLDAWTKLTMAWDH